MAKATATCTCETCGKEFTVEKICYNRRDADSWESWAVDHICECSDCYKKRTAEEARKEAKAYDLPEIEAVSEKQRAFADVLRNKYVAKNKTAMARAQRYIDDPDGYQPRYAKPLPPDANRDKVQTFLSIEGFYKAYIALTCKEARVIIDTMLN